VLLSPRGVLCGSQKGDIGTSALRETPRRFLYRQIQSRSLRVNGGFNLGSLILRKTQRRYDVRDIQRQGAFSGIFPFRKVPMALIRQSESILIPVRFKNL